MIYRPRISLPQQLHRESVKTIHVEDLLKFVATMCVDKLWSNNWELISGICTKMGISLIRYRQRENDGKFQFSFSIGIHCYEYSVILTDEEMAFNHLVLHFLSNYGKKKVCQLSIHCRHGSSMSYLNTVILLLSNYAV